MSEKSLFDAKLVGLCGTDSVYSTEDVERLKQETNEGDYIEFMTEVMDEDGHFKQQKVRGIVEKTYPFIFKLHYNNRHYTWVDYLLGKKRKA